MRPVHAARACQNHRRCRVPGQRSNQNGRPWKVWPRQHCRYRGGRPEEPQSFVGSHHRRHRACLGVHRRHRRDHACLNAACAHHRRLRHAHRAWTSSSASFSCHDAGACDPSRRHRRHRRAIDDGPPNACHAHRDAGVARCLRRHRASQKCLHPASMGDSLVVYRLEDCRPRCALCHRPPHGDDRQRSRCRPADCARHDDDDDDYVVARRRICHRTLRRRRCRGVGGSDAWTSTLHDVHVRRPRCVDARFRHRRSRQQRLTGAPQWPARRRHRHARERCLHARHLPQAHLAPTARQRHGLCPACHAQWLGS
mmetsp:Transcript_26381/g.91746  ORF Transcript_26381/g.91746 Transcript_26381/m.91746 type:complete len:311 (+) Transcript_26381:452-1384(+)